MDKLICYSGAAKGSDQYWRMVGLTSGILSKCIDYTTSTLDRLNSDQLAEVEAAYIKAATDLARPFIPANTYIGKLLRRDYLQAKAGDAVYAIGHYIAFGVRNAKGYINRAMYGCVDGGTGYCVQMAINLGKPVFLFDQMLGQWMYWDYKAHKFLPNNGMPVLTPKFTGVGTRELNNKGAEAIRDLYAAHIGLYS